LAGAYINARDDLDINHVQFSMVDNETFLAGLCKELEEDSEFVVRVVGYSTHFRSLNKENQDTIIVRTIQDI